ncbi:MAG: hypothetical protein WCB46_05015 [Methanoregula sp.]
MREKIFTLFFMVVLLGMMGSVPPVDAGSPDTVWFPLRGDDSGDPEDGRIEIDLVHANYATRANVGEQNKKLYYELKAYNPSGIPPIVTWGMVQARIDGSLLFKGKFDSITLAWIESYGLTGATFSIKHIQPI